MWQLGRQNKQTSNSPNFWILNIYRLKKKKTCTGQIRILDFVVSGVFFTTRLSVQATLENLNSK